jgi:hypothetical protein
VLEEEMRRCQALASWNVELGTAGAAARVMNLDPEAAAAAAVARWDDARPQGGDGPTLGSPESLQQLEQGVVAAAAAVDWAAALAGGRAARELAVAQNAYEARVAPLLRLLGVVQVRRGRVVRSALAPLRECFWVLLHLCERCSQTWWVKLATCLQPCGSWATSSKWLAPCRHHVQLRLFPY